MTGPVRRPARCIAARNVFVLLEHDTRPAPDAAAPSAEALHWDFMVEIPAAPRLATWRLLNDPLTGISPIAAVALGDHRRDYLEYQGEVSAGRGRVRRVDRGSATVELFDGGRLIVRLNGARLRGRFEIAAAPGGRLEFRALTA